MAVLFDANGTLFDLAPVRLAFAQLDAPPLTLEAWFARTLHGAATVTLAGAYRPFQELAAASLRTTLAQAGLDPSAQEPLDAMRELEPYADAEEALARVRGAGAQAFVLTNSARESTEEQLAKAGLDGYVERVLTCDDVRAFKPAAAPYGLAPPGSTLVAAHGWDVVGARAAALRAVWVDRLEQEWPFPGEAPPLRAPGLVEAVELALV